MRFLPIAFFLSVAAIPAAAQFRQPDGSGDPSATKCMTGEKPTGSAMPLRICYTNAEWAALKAQYIVITPSGRPFLSADAPAGTEVIAPDGKPLLKVNDPRNIHLEICTKRPTANMDCNKPF